MSNWPPTESQWRAYLERERLERRAARRKGALELVGIVAVLSAIVLATQLPSETLIVWGVIGLVFLAHALGLGGDK